MRRITSTIAACTLAAAVSVFAQEQAPAQPQPPAAREQAPKSTLTGCVVQAKTTDGGSVYVISKVQGGSAPMYVLAGPTESDFSANVSKKIEVTGPVQEPPAAAGDAPKDPNVVRPPTIIAESVKVVAENCT
jgi:hypothetical protein